MANTRIEVHGAKELRRQMRRTGDQDLKRALREAYNRAAEPVSDEAGALAPKVSGKLSASVRTGSTQSKSRVKIGSKARVPYAGPIIYGWPERAIEPHPFVEEALDEKLGEARAIFEEEVYELTKRLETSLGGL